MRRRMIILFVGVMLQHLSASGQNENEYINRASALESDAERKDAEPDDDSYELDLDHFKKHPVNLNTVSEEFLLSLHILNVFQVGNLISYRKLIGPLVSVYELQAVPGWDVETIRIIFPYVSAGPEQSIYRSIKQRLSGGDRSFIIRMGQVLEKSRGYEKPDSAGTAHYEGSPQKIFMRYIYNYKQLMSYGFTGDKDAGEPFLRSAQRYGFDFYSFHFFLRQTGMIRALVIGDFSVSFGQGLIQWQGVSFTKTNQPLAIKREGEILRPYHSAGEFNFHRGIGITLQKGNIQGSLFSSIQRISTHLTEDTTAKDDLFSSFQQSGYHRTASEIADRYNSTQFSCGGNLQIKTGRSRFGLNWIHFEFSRPFVKKAEPYNLFSLKGRKLTDYSLDYQTTFKNIHYFGELAADHQYHVALIQGAIISLGENVDLSFLYRNISRAYLSLYSDAFTENSTPVNEQGLYSGFVWKPLAGWRVDIYYDTYTFPWLKYQTDAPSGGRDFLVRLNYQPDKKTQLGFLYKNESKSGNVVSIGDVIPHIASPGKRRWRMDMNCEVSGTASLMSRMEYVQVQSAATLPQKGFMGMMAFGFRHPVVSGNFAVTFFETDSYDTRIYTYQPDLLYNFSLPVFFNKGMNYYINLHRDLVSPSSKTSHFKMTLWVKWAQTFYRGAGSVGSGLDEIKGNRKSEFKIQVLTGWN